ncbi:MAG: glycoside hydrolase family 9 protein [Phocaeicola sp.]
MNKPISPWRIAIFASLFCLLTSCEQPNGTLRVNQIAYLPQQEKIALFEGETSDFFTLTNAETGDIVWSGTPFRISTSAISGKKRSLINFSELTVPGNYLLQSEKGKEVPITIRSNGWNEVAHAALKTFYYQRSGMEIESSYAGKWARPLGHPDTNVLIHANAHSEGQPAGSVLSSPMGWYDAGDYNKYIVNSAYSIGLMLRAYQMDPSYFQNQLVSIPESNNEVPDVLDEIYYNLQWMLTMQDPTDGGVYHKLTTPHFEGFVQPKECHQQRYVVNKSITATLDFAAVMALASKVYSAYEESFPGFSEAAKQGAEAAYGWAKINPTAYYNQKELNKHYEPTIHTGEYGDNDASDEWYWAATELYLLTGSAAYLADARKQMPQVFTPPSWEDVAALGTYAWVEAADKGLDTTLLWNQLQAYCDTLVSGVANSAFHTPFGNTPKDFFWGCLERCTTQAFSLLVAYHRTHDATYLKAAAQNADYLFGRNPTGYCYVTGFGQKSPMHIHQRLSASDGIVEPIPGFLVGGPNPGIQDKAEVTYPSSFADECYADVEASYASNEIAINWNAGLVAMISLLDAWME